MPKLQITLPEEMQAALQQAASIEDRVVAVIVRQAIAAYLLQTHNIEVAYNMEWGGNRHQIDSEE